MAYLVAKRIYKDEIVLIAQSRMSMQQAQRKLSEVATFPGQLDRNNEEGFQGELWIEIETEQRTIETDPVCFLPEHAHAALVRTGMRADMATRLLSDEYARDWLTNYYGGMGRVWSKD